MKKLSDVIGIYVFENIKEKKAYIGQSIDVERRIYEHYHSFRYKNDFHTTLREHPEYFIHSIIEKCSKEELDDKEVYWMNRYESEGWELYNTCKKKFWMNCRGKKHSEETRKKIRKSLEGKLSGENHPLYGKHHSEETRKKSSESHKGQVAWNKGLTGIYSEETRKKMSKAAKGREPWNKGLKMK